MPSSPSRSFISLVCAAIAMSASARCVPAQPAQPAQPAPDTSTVLLRPDRVYDGTDAPAHAGWVVLVRGDRIVAAGPVSSVTSPAGARTIDLAGTTLMPGLIDAHTHVLLHPYNETPWDDQVLKEPLALRVCRANNHLKSILLSGFTTIRDLGTEGAGYADVGLKQAVEQKISVGPRMLVVTRAIVATRSYAPKGFAPEWRLPQGADVEVFRLMANKGAALCPTLAAGEATSRYGGWRPAEPEPAALKSKRAVFKEALEAGVTIINGSDMGVFPHGDGARELELLVD